MKKNMKNLKSYASAIATGAIVLGSVIPAFASTASTTKAAARMQKVSARDDSQISSRIDAMNKMSDRISSMKNVSDSIKSSITSDIKSQINALTALKAKIDADTDATALKEDTKEITSAYRIYALVLPKAAILAASDRVNTLVSKFTTLGGKLEARIAEASGRGVDVTSANTALADLKAKLSDASAQSNGAVNLVAGLSPDNGDKTIAASNKSALESARAKIKLAKTDLEAARKDVKAITDVVKKKDTKNASSTPETK